MDDSPSVRLVTDAIGALPSALDDAEALPMPPFGVGPAPLTTGVGASEGPARLLASRLLEAGLPARFVPIAELSRHRAPHSAAIVFSQGLSPNARHALAALEGLPTFLVTSRPVAVADLAPTVTPFVVPPRQEPPSLVRFVGPTVATAVAVRLAAHFVGREPPCGASAAYRGGLGRGLRLPRGLAAVVTAGVDADAAFGLRWKLLEALRHAGLLGVDVLSLAHGPLQSLDPRAGLLVLAAPGAEPLVERLRASVGARPVVVLDVGDGPFAALTAAAAVDEALARTVSAEGLDLLDWPGRGAESALYELGR